MLLHRLLIVLDWRCCQCSRVRCYYSMVCERGRQCRSWPKTMRNRHRRQTFRRRYISKRPLIVQKYANSLQARRRQKNQKHLQKRQRNPRNLKNKNQNLPLKSPRNLPLPKRNLLLSQRRINLRLPQKPLQNHPLHHPLNCPLLVLVKNEG